MNRFLFAASACFLIAGCAAGAEPAAPQASVTQGPTRAQWGHALAQRMCAACHQVEATGVSPYDAAPPFKVLASRYNEVTLGRKLDDIAIGHYKMPPTHVTNDEIDSLVTYLESLNDDWPKAGH